MKTAMQELIDLMKSHEARGWGNMTFDFFYAQLDEMKALEKEKEQSIELIKQTAMFMAAAPLDEEIAKMSYEDVYNSYYNQTYNQNEG